MNRRYVICAYRPWNIELFKDKLSKLPYEFYLISNKDELTLERLKEINPEIIFFLDWSWIVPKQIHTNYRCVVFHAAPLPKFRGGSPIQNQIIRGKKKTKLTAFFMDEGIDTGDILLQEDLSLEGHLRDIFKRITEISYRMIVKIINGEYIVRKQKGKGSYYRRRRPEESELKMEDFNKPLCFLYNFIRMLEDPYPNAYIIIGNKKVVFKEANFDRADNKLSVVVEITERSSNEENIDCSSSSR
jgi:methionyl-tRNA formyltransferase